ncbi:MAG: hypothetical protein HeimC2_13790 [Candidatus Heimdallarchaeota archaeon LC_2]|nr:MAG: hypothetical protein HeimC2_13790 [Candidatus Heimdallarchaeota archaeon LC_2]
MKLVEKFPDVEAQYNNFLRWLKNIKANTPDDSLILEELKDQMGYLDSMIELVDKTIVFENLYTRNSKIVLQGLKIGSINTYFLPEYLSKLTNVSLKKWCKDLKLRNSSNLKKSNLIKTIVDSFDM